jgi:hypothetical protein
MDPKAHLLRGLHVVMFLRISEGAEAYRITAGNAIILAEILHDLPQFLFAITSTSDDFFVVFTHPLHENAGVSYKLFAVFYGPVIRRSIHPYSPLLARWPLFLFFNPKYSW